MWPSGSNDFMSIGQLSPALRAAAGKHLATISCFHSFSKAMLFLPLTLLRLIGSNHKNPSFQGQPCRVIVYRMKRCKVKNLLLKRSKVLSVVIFMHFYTIINIPVILLLKA